MKNLEQLGISPMPWKTSIYGEWVDDNNGKPVATSDKDDNAVNSADLRLIAAAPELYEALRKVVEQFGSTSEYEESILQIARIALAKAGGAE